MRKINDVESEPADGLTVTSMRVIGKIISDMATANSMRKVSNILVSGSLISNMEEAKCSARMEIL